MNRVAEEVLLDLQGQLRGLSSEIATALRVVRNSSHNREVVIRHLTELEAGIRGVVLPLDVLNRELLKEASVSEKDFLGWVARELYGECPHTNPVRGHVLARIREL